MKAIDFINENSACRKGYKQGVAEALGYKEIEFVCVNSEFLGGASLDAQKALYKDLKQLKGVIPLYQDFSEYGPQQLSLTAIYKDPKLKKEILSLAKQHGVEIDIIKSVSDDYANRALNKDHDYQIIEASDDIPKIVYHVTPTKNIKSIAKEGLKPGIGDRSSKIMREKSGIYVFPSRLAAEDAVMNWLGDEFEDEPLTMLKIDTSGLEDHISKGAGYELIIDTIIEPNRIKKVNISLEEASGYIPSKAQKNDPRYKTALTVDVKPDSIQKNAKAFGFKTSRAGIPPTARPNGKV